MNAPFKITPNLIAEHGLKPDEYQRILDLLGREPTLTELGYRHPELAARVQRRGGADRMAGELAAGQADKR